MRFSYTPSRSSLLTSRHLSQSDIHLASIVVTTHIAADRETALADEDGDSSHGQIRIYSDGSGLVGNIYKCGGGATVIIIY
jgi:hypothetical protein